MYVKVPRDYVLEEGGEKKRQRGEDIIIITVFNPLDTHTHTHTPGRLLINYLATGDSGIGLII